MKKVLDNQNNSNSDTSMDMIIFKLKVDAATIYSNVVHMADAQRAGFNKKTEWRTKDYISGAG